MIPYTRHHVNVDDEAAVLRALRSGYLTQGPETEALEAELAAEVGTEYAVAVSSGTAALFCAYRAGTGTVWAVSIPAITFVATQNALPKVFGIEVHDVDPLTGVSAYCTGALDPYMGDVLVAQCHGGAIPAIPVFSGRLILDAAHALGGNLRSWAAAGATICLSLHAAKQVCAGEGGAVCTNSLSVAEDVRRFRNHGRLAKEAPTTWGLNLRMTEMSAALGRSQLKRLRYTRQERREQYEWYEAMVTHTTPIVQKGPGDAYHLCQILTDHAPALREALGSPLHYPPLADLPGARTFAARVVTLPLYSGLSLADQSAVLATVHAICG